MLLSLLVIRLFVLCFSFFSFFALLSSQLWWICTFGAWCLVQQALIPILTQVPTGAVPPIAAYTMFAPLLARQFSQIQRLGGEHQGAEDEILSEIRTVFSKAMGNDSNFPFMMLQPMGSGCKILPVPALSASFLWTARKNFWQCKKCDLHHGSCYITNAWTWRGPVNTLLINTLVLKL